MKRTQLLFMFLLIQSVSFAQDSLLIGKWQIKEMWQDSVLIFDYDNINASYIAKFLNETKHGKILTKTDSIKIMKTIKKVHAKYKLLFYEFGKAGNFAYGKAGNMSTGVLTKNGDSLKFIKKLGGYLTDVDRLLIFLVNEGSDYSSSSSFRFKIKEDVLILIPEGGIKGYATYRKIKK